MPAHVDWSSRREEFTKRALLKAKSIDWPSIPIRIYYPSNCADYPPAYYVLDLNLAKVITRKQAAQFVGMVFTYLPDGEHTITWKGRE